MARPKKTEIVDDVAVVAESATTEPVQQPVAPLTFAEVMRIHRQQKADGLLPPDPQPVRKKRPKTKRF